MRFVENHWYRDTHSFLSFCLLPLSLLFGAVVYARRALYRSGLKKTYHAPVPVIVVGNITTGGTGKTPLVIWLANFLKAQGYKPGIVSRGCGGDGTIKSVAKNSSAKEAGDEAVLIARRTGCVVVTATDRVAAVQKLLAEQDCDIVISDDGLQHYRLGRQVEIAMVDGSRRFGNQSLLPAGPLREPVSRLRQVDFVVTQQQAGVDEFEMVLDGDEVVAVNNAGLTKSLQDFKGTQVHAVAALGNPQRFFTSLRAQGIYIIEHRYPDHYHFRKKDLYFGDDLPVIMTEKDAVKCAAVVDPRHWYLPVQAVMAPLFGESLLKKIGADYA
ncbi:MAG: tetraacyldisaccharide 4'-kinase [Pseudomonadota bacterium]